jgi:type II secretory pathway pseudopilin PulG
MPVKAKDESGFTMIMTVIGITLVMLLAAVAVTAVNGSAQGTSQDIARKQAYEAALAGINEYAYHLHHYSAYWSECTEAGATGEVSALNQMGSTANKRPMPGEPKAQYAIELIPATGHSKCEWSSTSIEKATQTMIESSEPMKGTFRIRSTGFYGKAKASITATFKPASFLDYVYFTQLETSDPVTYGNEELIKAAEVQCIKTIEGKRYSTPFTNEAGKFLNEQGEVITRNSQNGRYYNSKGEEGSLQYCDTISFVGGDNIKGPMHTNDAFVICEKPTLGRSPSDPLEVSNANKPGWYSTYQIPNSGSNCTGSEANFESKIVYNSQTLVPPQSNEELESIAEPTFKFNGEIRVCLEGAKMTVGRGKTCKETVIYKGNQPANGVIYDKSVNCSTAYSPFFVTYPEKASATGCGNVLLEESKYSKPLTIAAANNILIMDNVEKESGSEEGMLGLIATNFIRVYHPVQIEMKRECTGNGNNQKCTERQVCGSNLAGANSNLNIEAALLALQHSFIVDNYRCGARLGNLNVYGAIAQKFRGAVGTTGNSGYLKNYEYDERLKTTEPPYFIEPVKSDWVVGRETTE